MSKEQCSNISTQFESVALPKSGVVRTTDKNLVRAPESIGGYGIKDLYTKQFISHIQALIDHGTSTSVTGQLIRILGEGVLWKRIYSVLNQVYAHGWNIIGLQTLWK